MSAEIKRWVEQATGQALREAIETALEVHELKLFYQFNRTEPVLYCPKCSEDAVGVILDSGAMLDEEDLPAQISAPCAFRATLDEAIGLVMV